MKNKYLKSNYFGIRILTAALWSLLLSCGPKAANPVPEKYQTLVGESQPLNHKPGPARVQTFNIPGLIDVTLPEEMSFYLNEKIVYDIPASVADGETQITLKIVEKIDWLQLIPSPESSNHWKLIGEPPASIFKDCQNDSTLLVHFEVQVLRTPNQATANALSNVNKVFAKTLHLKLRQVAPNIVCLAEKCNLESIVTENLTLREGESKEFDILVYDPLGSDRLPPELLSYFNPKTRNPERNDLPGTSFVSFLEKEPKRISSQYWLFRQKFEARDLGLSKTYLETLASRGNTLTQFFNLSFRARSLGSCLWSAEKQGTVQVQLESLSQPKGKADTKAETKSETKTETKSETRDEKTTALPKEVK